MNNLADHTQVLMLPNGVRDLPDGYYIHPGGWHSYEVSIYGNHGQQETGYSLGGLYTVAGASVYAVTQIAFHDSNGGSLRHIEDGSGFVLSTGSIYIASGSTDAAPIIRSLMGQHANSNVERWLRLNVDPGTVGRRKYVGGVVTAVSELGPDYLNELKRQRLNEGSPTDNLDELIGAFYGGPAAPGALSHASADAMLGGRQMAADAFAAEQAATQRAFTEHEAHRLEQVEAMTHLVATLTENAQPENTQEDENDMTTSNDTKSSGTFAMAKRAGAEGAKFAAAKKSNDALVAIVKNGLIKQGVPKAMLQGEMASQFLAWVSPLIVHFAADQFSNIIPRAPLVRAICERAFTVESADTIEKVVGPIIDSMTPDFMKLCEDMAQTGSGFGPSETDLD